LKKIITNGLKVIGVKFAMSFISIALMIAFTWLYRLPGGFRIYSCLTAFFMCWWIFVDAAMFGRKKYSEKYSVFQGFLCGAICEIPSVLLLIAMSVFKNAFMPLNIAFCIYNAMYMGIFKPDGKIFLMQGIEPLSIVVLLIVPIVYFIGFTLGKKGYEPNGSIIYKLVYKGGDNNEKKKNS